MKPARGEASSLPSGGRTPPARGEAFRRKPPEVKLPEGRSETSSLPSESASFGGRGLLPFLWEDARPPARGEASSLPSGGRASSRRKGTSSHPEGRELLSESARGEAFRRSCDLWKKFRKGVLRFLRKVGNVRLSEEGRGTEVFQGSCVFKKTLGFFLIAILWFVYEGDDDHGDL